MLLWILFILSLITGFLYAAVISYFTYGWLKLKEEFEVDAKEKIKVSIIVPFRNEAENLEALMDCLMKQNYDLDNMEVVLVDDHSEDASCEMISNFIKDKNLHHFTLLRLDDEDGFSKKAALKKGIENSNGELIITTDADCTMGANWLSAIVSKYTKEKCQMISAPVCIEPEKSFFSKLQTLEFFSLIGCGAGAIAMNKAFLANGANLSFTRSLYKEVNGYANHINYASGDDVFMLLQAKQKHSVAFLKNREAIVYTKGAASLKAFFHQRIRWASKSSGYKDAAALLTAFSVFTMNAGILLLLGIGFLNSACYLFSSGLFLLKLAVDFVMFCSVARFNKLSILLWYYIPLQILYTIYIIVTAFLAMLIPFEWKSRKMRK